MVFRWVTPSGNNTCNFLEVFYVFSKRFVTKLIEKTTTFFKSRKKAIVSFLSTEHEIGLDGKKQKPSEDNHYYDNYFKTFFEETVNGNLVSLFFLGFVDFESFPL